MIELRSLIMERVGREFYPEALEPGHGVVEAGGGEDGAEEDEEEDEEDEEGRFAPAPRETEADRKNDHRSIQRALDRSLYLLVKCSAGSDWQFPQRVVKGEQETMRAAAARAVVPTGGGGGEGGEDDETGRWETYFYGNAPVGFRCNAYDKDVQKESGAYGRKCFFFRAHLIDGQEGVELEGTTDFVWVTREELGEYLSDEEAAYVQDMLF